MAWRLYYTLEEAAEKLSREFNDTYTANDLIHYAAIGLVELYINGIGREYYFAKRPFYDLAYDEEEKGKYAELPESAIYGGDLIPITKFDAMHFEGGREYIEINNVDKLAVIGTHGELVKIYAESSSEWKDLETLVYCLIPNELLGNLFQISSEDEPTKREEIDKPENVIKVKRHDLCILQGDLTILQQDLAYRIKGKKEKEVNDKKSLLNIISALKDMLIDKGIYKNQAEIIEYLANEAEGYGLSEASLKAKFAEANKLKKSN
ncbi:hypothetical protein [Neisseria polysaccharea]|uniref:hypothetical protein n=1 Tax=Neisseria TaxID=482 RepID=UPI000E59AFD9|nr:hypothetical protein [Neisseria polysaccharea]MBS0039272.1 hypothetical protein [Neisseria sp. Marseille-Q1983]